ncbi:MAG: TlyA family RNA methyltransferase, partial [Acidobacteria bacterium]|nr:TlyA family RNA methyltransferase [Acidobacteriota bacterium]
LVERGLVGSRERAQALIIGGKVLVEEQKIEKAGTAVNHDAAIRLLAGDRRYVSRGGSKLEKALDYWKISVTGKVCLDIGSSTGGFSDCLLQHGAGKVIAVDTGYGQLDLKVRQDSRVRLLENMNARFLTKDQISEVVDLIAVDVSFISATLVLPAVVRAAFPEFPGERAGRQLVVLVKPQFEVGREHVGKRGIVRDQGAQSAAVDRVRHTVLAVGFSRSDVIESPILGAGGNREFLLYASI